MPSKPTYKELEMQVHMLEKRLAQAEFCYGGLVDPDQYRSLEDAYRKYEFIANNSRDFMTLIDRNYIYEAVNDPYCQAHKKSRAEIIGSTVADVWGERIFNSVIRDYLDRCFTGEVANYEGWFEFQGLRRCFHVIYSPYWEKGRVTHAVVVSRDITGRKKAEQALKRESDVNTAIAELAEAILSSDSIEAISAIVLHYARELTLSRYGSVEYVQPETGEFIPAAKDAPARGEHGPGKEAEGNGTPAYRLSVPACTRIETRCVGRINVERPGQDYDQTDRLLMDRLAMIYAIAIEHKQMEEDQLKKEKFQSIIEIAGAVCHEINQPLQAISGYCELMLMEIGKEDLHYNKVKGILRQVNRIGGITKKLMGITTYVRKDYDGENKIIDIEKASM